jgi:uncharacterized paraquat-inducible protein A
MTDLEIGLWIEGNLYNPDRSPMCDFQTFYEGAKWMREQLLKEANDNIPICKDCDFVVLPDKTAICKKCAFKTPF